MRKLYFVLLILVSLFCQSCIDKGKNDDNSNSSTVVTLEESSNDKLEEKNEKIIFDVIKESFLYAQPSSKSNKLINQKATQALGEVYYLSVATDCKVVVLEEDSDWSKIQVEIPEHLRSSHIGWVKTDILSNPADIEEDTTKYEENIDYQIFYSKKMGTAVNIYVLLLWKDFDRDSLNKLAKFIKTKESNGRKCNIHLYDTSDIVPLIEKYPLEGQEYVKMADHYVFMLSFDGSASYYPLIDSQYKKYGGKKQIN